MTKIKVQPKIILDKLFKRAWLSFWQPSLNTYGGICHSNSYLQILKFYYFKILIIDWVVTIRLQSTMLCYGLKSLKQAFINCSPSEVRILNKTF